MLIANFTRSASEEDNARRAPRFQQLGQDILSGRRPIVGGLGDAQSRADPIPAAEPLSEQLAYQTLGLGVRGTPAFLIGYSSKERAEVRIVKRLVGDPPYTVVAEVVAPLLSEAP